jgi:hypothetical protein
MDGTWMTYAEAGAHMGASAEAVRRRALREHWARTPGNDGRTRVCVPADVNERRPPRSPVARPSADSVVLALEAHIATLKAS